MRLGEVMIKIMQVVLGVAVACTLTGTAASAQTVATAATTPSRPDQAFTRLADNYFDTYYFPTNPNRPRRHLRGRFPP